VRDFWVVRGLPVPEPTKSDDDRVRWTASAWVYEHAWGKPKEYDPASEKPAGPQFDPRAYSPEQLDVIEAALKLLLNPPKSQAEPEIIPPDQPTE
jgi:hypothetical protein